MSSVPYWVLCGEILCIRAGAVLLLRSGYVTGMHTSLRTCRVFHRVLGKSLFVLCQLPVRLYAPAVSDRNLLFQTFFHNVSVVGCIVAECASAIA